MKKSGVNKSLLNAGLILIIPVFLTCGGCAFGTREVTLSPIIANGLPPKITVRTEVIQVIEPEDARGLSPCFVGYVRNGFGIHTADVVNHEPVQEWVQKSLVENLRAAGYNAVGANGKNSGLVISSTITKLDCDMYMSYTAVVNITIFLKENKQVIFSKSYEGNASALAVLITPGEYQSVLTQAMQNCINSIMPELLAKLAQIKVSIKQPIPSEMEIQPYRNQMEAF